MDYKTLSNGVKMPILGFGVYQVQILTNVSAWLVMRFRLVTAQLTPLKLI